MKKILFFLSICCLFYSCDHYIDLPRDKTPLLKTNDVIYFMDSASNRIDTFSLNIVDNWHQTAEGDYFRYIEIYYNKLDKKTIFIQTNITSASSEYAAFSIIFSKSNFNTSLKTINFNLHGLIYPNVYVVNDIAILPSDTIPKKVYFTCQNGIIRYEYKDGRVYNLVSK